MRVIIGCECSGRIREAFLRRGHDAYSCDIKPSEDGGPHIQDNILAAMHFGWDLMIAHPDCTFLTVANTYIKRGCSKYTLQEAAILQKAAIDFFMALMRAPIDRIGNENPIGIMSTVYRQPDQIIHPWQFGDDASKATCLWLKNLPLLKPTKCIAPRIVDGRKRWANQTDSGQNRLGPSPTRSADRARTYPGIAEAMAEQWS